MTRCCPAERLARLRVAKLPASGEVPIRRLEPLTVSRKVTCPEAGRVPRSEAVRVPLPYAVTAGAESERMLGMTAPRPAMV